MPRQADPIRSRRTLPCRIALPVLALLCTLAWSPGGTAQVNRCEHSDGTVAFTDHRCPDTGAVEHKPASSVSGRHRIYRGGCARNEQDLMFEMATAIDGGDANRLASVYHWVGMSSSGATAVMKRLDEVVRRPLVDIVPVIPESDPDPVPMRASFVTGPAAVQSPVATVEPAAGRYYPSTVVETRPVALRVVQTLDNGVTPADTVFGLHRYFGCLWLTG